MKPESTINLCAKVDGRLSSFLQDHGFQRLRCDGFHVEYENTYVKFVFEQYEETSLRFWFSNARTADTIQFQVSIYLDAILGTPNDISLRPTMDNTTVDAQIEIDLNYLESTITKHLSAPISGDFSWIEAYRKRENQLAAFDHFLGELARSRDSRRLSIQIKKRKGDPTWESDARALYKEINGKDFE
jgi:hypothetical protein